MRPRIIFLNRYFFPDHSASSQLLSDLAFHLARQGEDVHVITSRRPYGGPAHLLPAKDTTGGVEVHRIWTSAYGKASLAGRVIDFLSFHASSMVRLARLARPGDVVIANTDPPMLSLVTVGLAGVKRFKTVNWLHDIYPEVATTLGVASSRGPVGKTLVRLRNRSLRRANMNITIGEDMAKRVLGLGVRPQAIRVIQNWSDDHSLEETEGANPLRKEWSLEGKFVVAYSGNLGRAHEFETLLGAAEQLRDRSDIRFLFIGGGFHFQHVETEVKRRGLQNFVFKPYQPRERLAVSMSVADIHWLSLRPELGGLMLPSKFYGIAAARRPILAVTSPAGELAQLVRVHDCGVAIAPGDAVGLAQAIVQLEQSPLRCATMGANARKMLDENFSKARALQRWSDVIGEIAAERSVTVRARRSFLAGLSSGPAVKAEPVSTEGSGSARRSP